MFSLSQRAEAGLDGVKQLNPHVHVTASKAHWNDLDLKQYDLCCVSGLPLSAATELNEKAHKSGVHFLVCDTHGKQSNDLANNQVLSDTCLKM